MDKLTKAVSPKERLEHLISVLGLKPAAFAREILGNENLKARVSNYLLGKYEPKADFWKQVHQALPEADPDWLYRGLGSPYYPGLKPVEVLSVNEQLESLRKRVAELERENELLKRDKAMLEEKNDTVIMLAQAALRGKLDGVSSSLFDQEGASELLTNCVIKRVSAVALTQPIGNE